MLKLTAELFDYCPTCGQKLLEKIEEGDKLRTYCPDHGTFYPHVAASGCAVITRAGKILLVKRNHNPYKDKWMFPAGYVEYGEHPAETAVREVAEETGLKAKIVKLLDVLQSTDDYRAPGHFAFFFLTEVSGNIKLDMEENTDIGWFDINDVPELAFKGNREIMVRLQNGEW